jgi:hypothetical protein
MCGKYVFILEHGAVAKSNPTSCEYHSFGCCCYPYTVYKTFPKESNTALDAAARYTKSLPAQLYVFFLKGY